MRDLISKGIWQLICDQCSVKSPTFRGVRASPSAWSEFRHSIVIMKNVERLNKKGRPFDVRTGILRHHCPKCAQVLADMIESSRTPIARFSEYECRVGYRCSYKRN